MIKNQLFIAAALLTGVAVGYLMKPDASASETDDAEARVTESKIDDSGATASLQALRARIAELERQLADKDAERPVEVAETKPKGDDREANNGPGSRMRDFREHMEWLKKEKPAEYEQLTKSMAQWRQRRIDRAHSKLDFLSSIDTSTMTDEQKANHEKFQDMLVRREELEEKMSNPDMTDEDREDILREMHNMGHTMRQAAHAERETLISQTVQALGYSGDDAADVSSTFKEILSVTETRGGPPMGAGGPPPSAK